MIQILSISLQLSGAVILLLWCLKGASKEQVVRKYSPGSNTAKRDDEDNCRLSTETFCGGILMSSLPFISRIIILVHIQTFA